MTSETMTDIIIDPTEPMTSDQRRLMIGQQYNRLVRDASLAAGRMTYFMRAGPFIKIGYCSISTQRRLEELQTGCPFEIELLAWLPGGAETEQKYHRKFAHARFRGEWFHLDPELLDLIDGINSGRVQ